MRSQSLGAPGGVGQSGASIERGASIESGVGGRGAARTARVLLVRPDAVEEERDGARAAFAGACLRHVDQDARLVSAVRAAGADRLEVVIALLVGLADAVRGELRIGDGDQQPREHPRP